MITYILRYPASVPAHDMKEEKRKRKKDFMPLSTHAVLQESDFLP